ncbi:MAG: Hsp70 family protein, partial [Eubacterium sp.]|nr:Hsp70 family protein [Eubacterium sp.]
MAIIGIDLGTTNSLASVWKNGRCELIPNSFGEFLTPSVVGFDDDGSIIIGKIAKQRLISHPDLTAASFKCFMGTNKEIMLGNKSFTPPELSSFILRQLKEDAELYLGEPVEEAVISVPAYFDDNGRSATKLAGELAGLKVERIINEPSAAALAYKQNTDNEDMFLIFDFGGGTLDISIVDIFESVIEIVAVAGDNH